MTRTEIRDLFDRHISVEKLKSALELLLESGLAKPVKKETKGRAKEIWFACDKSDKSVLSSKNPASEKSFNAKNAKNADEINNSENCRNCDLPLELSNDGMILYCPFGCGSRNAN